MKHKLSEAIVKKLPIPTDTSSRIYYDSDIRGFGCRVTANGHKTLLLNYSFHGTERRMKLADFYPDMNTVALARQRAAELKNQIVAGKDPVAEQMAKQEASDKEDREQYTFAELAARYQRDYRRKKTGLPKRPASKLADKSMLDGVLLPRWGQHKLRDIVTRDIETLMEERRSTPYRANRLRSLLQSLFAFGIKHEMGITKNPVTTDGVLKYAEPKREFFLDEKQLAAFTDACDRYPDQQAASILKLLLETGSRKSEVLQARWEQFHFEPGPLHNTWVKPPHLTKQGKEVHLAFSKNVLPILLKLGPQKKGFLFPGKGGFDKPRRDIWRPWVQICKMAGLCERIERKGKRRRVVVKYRPILRLHDLRHSFASYLASHGESLVKIGKILGHEKADTTLRYAKASTDSQRATANVFADRVPPVDVTKPVRIRIGRNAKAG